MRNFPHLLNWFCLGLLLIWLPACAPLHHDNTLAEDVGEVVIRALMAPATLGVSELILAHARERQQQERERQAAYALWFNSLSPAQQERERDRRLAREQAAMQALGLIFLGTGFPFAQPPAVQPPRPAAPPASTTCWSTTAGITTTTTCY